MSDAAKANETPKEVKDEKIVKKGNVVEIKDNMVITDMVHVLPTKENTDADRFDTIQKDEPRCTPLLVPGEPPRFVFLFTYFFVASPPVAELRR